jgi:twitching motility protein PilT
MRAAMRQAPKIIFIGEIRDRETMEIVLSAGETGHLVFSTLHTTSAAQSINRILGMFSKEEEDQVRERWRVPCVISSACGWSRPWPAEGCWSRN